MLRRPLFLILLIGLFASCASHRGHHGGGKHGNPEALGAYIKKLEDPERDEWQVPYDVFKAINLLEGQTLCDIGAGPGYMSFKAAKIVGEKGHIFSTDVEAEMTKALLQNIEKSSLRNITPILGLYDNPLLPPASCDYILIVNTYHHFSDRITYIKNLKKLLSPNGKLINIDFQKRDLPFGPKPEHKITREDFLEEAKKAGYALVKEHTFLKYQYFFILN